MWDQGMDLLQKLMLWQILLVLGVAAPFASHYGWGIDINYAVILFVGFTAVSIVVRYFPPPDTKRNGRPKIAISAHQSAFCSQFDDWVEFDVAASGKFDGPEDNETAKHCHQKLRELRLELGTAQMILERKIEGGKHYVKYFRADEQTTFVPSDRK